MSRALSDVLDKCMRELNSTDGDRFTFQSVLLKVWEALSQFAEDSQILRVQNYVIPLVDGQEEYAMPSDYISIIRLANGTKDASALTQFSQRDLDVLGASRYLQGTPTRYHFQTQSQYSIAVWPIPDADDVPDTNLVTPTDGSGKVFAITPDTDLTGHLVLDYVRDVNLPSPLPTHNESALSADPTLDTEIPDRYYDKLYLLVCALRLASSRHQADNARAPYFEQRYLKELLMQYKRTQRKSKRNRFVSLGR